MALTTITPIAAPFAVHGVSQGRNRAYYIGDAREVRAVTALHLVIRVALGPEESARYGADTVDLVVRRSELADDADLMDRMLGANKEAGDGVRARLRARLVESLVALREVLALPQTV